MKISRNGFERVKQAFSNCRQPDPVNAGQEWQQRVMRDIRHIGPLQQKTLSPYDLFTPLQERMQKHFWSFAPVACTLILLLSILISRIDMGTEYEMTQFFYGNQSESSLYQEFGFNGG